MAMSLRLINQIESAESLSGTVTFDCQSDCPPISFIMARTPRVVIPDHPHHIIQRGNRKQPVFFQKNDFQFYLDLLQTYSQEHDLDVLSYCLMPNHVHVIAVPGHEDAMRAVFAQVHKRYTSMINKREGWTGHLWQARFASYVMDEDYMLNALRYIEMNPVIAGIAARPYDYLWSSAKSRYRGDPNPILSGNMVDDLVQDWEEFWDRPLDQDFLKQLEQHARSGKPANLKRA